MITNIRALVLYMTPNLTPSVSQPLSFLPLSHLRGQLATQTPPYWYLVWGLGSSWKVSLLYTRGCGHRGTQAPLSLKCRQAWGHSKPLTFMIHVNPTSSPQPMPSFLKPACAWQVYIQSSRCPEGQSNRLHTHHGSTGWGPAQSSDRYIEGHR